jgi:hypothetical protein
MASRTGSWQWPDRSSSSGQSGSGSAPIPSQGPEPSEGIVRSQTAATSTSEDSQTVLISHSTDTNTEAPAAKPTSSGTVNAAINPMTSPVEPRHCWICLMDEGDKDADISEWKSPCPCNLQAHEECLLQWITELEASSAKSGKLSQAIQCPQCKADIKIQRPRDYIVSFTEYVKRAGRLLVLPAGVSAVCGCLYSASMVYGVNAISLVFGPDEAYRILTSPRRNMSLVKLLLNDRWYLQLVRFLRGTDPFLPFVPGLDWEVFFSLPMLAPALVLSRTTLADHAFSILPISVSLTSPTQS